MAARRALPSESNRTHEGPIDACVSCPPLRKGGFGKRTGGIAHLKRDWRHLPSNAFGRKARVGTWTRGFARANRESRRPVGVAGRRCPGPRPPAKAFGRATARTGVQLNTPSPNRNAALRRRIVAVYLLTAKGPGSASAQVFQEGELSTLCGLADRENHSDLRSDWPPRDRKDQPQA